MLLVCILLQGMIFSAVDSSVYADSPVLDQQQTQGNGSIWVDSVNKRWQTFTSGYTGYLSGVEIYKTKSYGNTGGIIAKIYTADGTKLLATQMIAARDEAGWLSVSFTTPPMLVRNVIYRLELSTVNVGSSGFGWYTANNNPYAGGSGHDIWSLDYQFKTYMLPDQSLSPSNSMIQSTALSMIANGTSTAFIDVQLKDVNNNDYTAGGDITLTTTLGTLDLVQNLGNGHFRAQFTSGTSTGLANVQAYFNGTLLKSLDISLQPGPFSVTESTISATPASVRADGNKQALITVVLKDDHRNSIAGKQVQLIADKGQSVIEAVYGTTNAAGQAQFVVSNVAAETVEYTAIEAESHTSLNQKALVTFTYDQVPAITLEADPLQPTYGNVDITVNAAVYGDYNTVNSIKWADGIREVVDFQTQGIEVVDRRFTVSSNGWYSVYVQDQSGNENVAYINISNILSVSDNADLAELQISGMGGQVPFAYSPLETQYAVTVSHDVYAIQLRVAAEDHGAVIHVNGSRVSDEESGTEYALAVGKNTFTIFVEAQDGKTHQTIVVDIWRADKQKDEDNDKHKDKKSDEVTSSGASAAIANVVTTPAPKIPVSINGQWFNEMATLNLETAKGITKATVYLDQHAFSQPLSQLQIPAQIRISLDNKVHQTTLIVPREALEVLRNNEATISLQTMQGQYSVPMRSLPYSTSSTEAHLVMGYSPEEVTTSIKQAAVQDGYQLVSEPMSFSVFLLDGGEIKQIEAAGVKAERLIFLPEGASNLPTTAVVSNKQGTRPVLTLFSEQNGVKAAAIPGFTNGAYALASQKSNFVDLKNRPWAQSAIEDMASRMILKGVDESHFQPEAWVTRAELATILVRALGLQEKPSKTNIKFRDIQKSDWFYRTVITAQQYGILTGYKDGTFQPDHAITRQEAIVALVRAMRIIIEESSRNESDITENLSTFEDQEQVAEWAREPLSWVIHTGALQGDGTNLLPHQRLTRAETAILVQRMLKNAKLIN
ncbi:S-layer homology domain-containing protein [Paenibacillus sp. BT-177]|uniref:S-layer homology domain-containing protein n=1 Tax=Paenibacillus sp. BT-177 TaxID=2986930 RepID=UPI0021F7CE76|nr:S-layer homology domain-containing protein [Paenibacillus sp. BT-177]